MGAPLLPKFWTALASLPGWATDRRDWRRRLGDEWPVVEPLLRGTGQVARAVECPSPGGDGCPRTVVRLPSGALRGVCGSSPAACDPVDLAPQDVVILEVNRRALCQGLASAFCTIERAEFDFRARLVRLGEYAVAAGIASDVHIAIVDPRDPLTDHDLHAAGVGQTSSIILVPDEAAIPATLRVRLADRGCRLVALPSTIVAQGFGVFGLALPVQDVLDPIHRALLARVKKAAGPSRIPLPAGAGWPQLTLTLVEAHTLVIACDGKAHRLDPGQLGMRSAKDNRPTSAWTFLTHLIAAEGFLRPVKPEKAKKQKQEAAHRLRSVCGIDGDPMPWDPDRSGYAAAFICRDERGGAPARVPVKNHRR